MSALRKILLPLLLIPLGMILYVSLYPDWQWENPGLELLFAVIGIPIVAINFITWFYPEVIRTYLPIREDWLQSREKPILLSTAISALVAFACIWFGAVSAVANAADRSSVKRFDARPITATAFARSVQALARATTSGELAVVSTPRASPEVTTIPDQTEQIPVSGGEPTDAPTASPGSFASSSNLPTLSVTQTEVVSAFAAPTQTAHQSGSCTPASPDYVDAIGQTVQDMNSENVVVAGWMVPSNAAEDLWFVGAKVQSDTGTTSLGVWALFAYSDGTFDIYAINQPAIDLSSADSGENSDPVLTMQSDGAQAAYHCAAQ